MDAQGQNGRARPPRKDGDESLVVAVSARALFDLEEPNRVFVEDGIGAYLEHQRSREEEPLAPGAAFHLVKGLLGLNGLDDGRRLVDVVILSSMHPDVALRVLNSLRHHGLDISRAAFTGGADVVPYLSAFHADLLLSRSETDVQRAVDAGIAAAVMYAPPERFDPESDQINIALDGDAVVFGEESERIYKERGLAAFLEHEEARAREPMHDGPFARLLRTLHALQVAAERRGRRKPFRLGIVTARGGAASERVLRTLRVWRVSIDAVFFMQGKPKHAVLAAFGAHLFIDDQDVHVGPASRVVPSGKVPYRSDSPIRRAAPA